MWNYQHLVQSRTVTQMRTQALVAQLMMKTVSYLSNSDGKLNATLHAVRNARTFKPTVRLAHLTFVCEFIWLLPQISFVSIPQGKKQKTLSVNKANRRLPVKCSILRMHRLSCIQTSANQLISYGMRTGFWQDLNYETEAIRLTPPCPTEDSQLGCNCYRAKMSQQPNPLLELETRRRFLL